MLVGRIATREMGGKAGPNTQVQTAWRNAKGQENREAAQRDAGIPGRYQAEQLTTVSGG